MDNALRVVRCLREAGEEAYFLKHESGLYGVTFGDFPSEADARKQGEHLVSRCSISGYRIVEPAVLNALQLFAQEGILRDKIVETTKRFVGAAYQWGSSSPGEGLDCSGLTAAVYRLNGLYLPRSSKEQSESVRLIKISQIKKGDLVFFTTLQKSKISHVGIYMGDGNFVHAPGSGKKIRFDSLSNGYFKSRLTGAGTFF